MASTLFQAGSAKASSSSANPFLDLAHFYEQEINELLIDARLSNSHASWNSSHLHSQMSFRTPSDSPRSASMASTEYSTFTGSSSASASASAATLDASSRTCNSSQSSSTSFSIPSQHRRWSLDDYAAEARKRSEDRHDGLGPIIDFSAPVIPSPTFSLESPSSSSSSSSSSSPSLSPWTSEDHWMHHRNPYATTAVDWRTHNHPPLPHHPHHHHHFHSHNDDHDYRLAHQNGYMRATSQNEQVWMDMEQAFQRATPSSASSSSDSILHQHHDKRKGKTVLTNHHQPRSQSDLTGEWEHMWNQPQSSLTTSTLYPPVTADANNSTMTVPTANMLTAASSSTTEGVFHGTTAMLPSEWPMAPWAIQTEAALMETEAMHHPHSSFAHTTDARHHNSFINKKEEYNDDEFEGDMLQSWISILQQEKHDADLAKEKEEAKNVEVYATDDSLKEESADPIVLDMALRRLQQLMGQLRVPSEGDSAHPHLVAAAAAASSIQQDIKPRK
ncbi:hypothetical protein BGW42_006452 [Actinomortierella wolfii]|nr:hypothetical protein BGW42_006452 [Actinomortierella wolfii]